MWESVVNGIGMIADKVLAPICNIIDQCVTDKDKSNELKAQIKLAFMKGGQEIALMVKDVVVAQLSSQHWLVANWLPMAAMACLGVAGYMRVVVGAYDWLFMGLFLLGYGRGFILNADSVKSIGDFIAAAKTMQDNPAAKGGK